MQSLCVQVLSHRCLLHSPSHRIWRGRTAQHKQEVMISHYTHANTDEYDIRSRYFSSIITVFSNNSTLWADCLLSDTLLARILNLSTQASKSSLTPTTNNRNTRWKQPETDHRIASKGILSSCLSERKGHTHAVSEKHTCRLHGFAWDRDLHGSGDQNPHSAVLWD